MPYASKQYVRFGFASGPGRIRFSYSGDFRDVFRNVGADIQVRYSGIENIRFNGFGNETRLDQPEAFYQVTLREVDVAPSLALHLSPSVRVTFGPRFRHARTVEGTGNLIDATSPVGRGTVNQIGGHVGFAVDTRDVDVAATRGVYVTARGFGAAGGRTDDVEYVGVSGEARTYLTARRLPTRPTLALRAAGKRVWGTYPYYEAAYLGGATSLRGFVEQRFAGDASVMGSAELRLFLTRYRILLPGEFGIFGLTDVGRVFFEGESSTRWHGGAGAGIWFAFVDPAATISAAFAKSVEQLGIYITLGFAY